jgi:hypothetical protein
MFDASDFTVENSEFLIRLIRRGWRMWSENDKYDGKLLLLCPLSDFENIPDGTIMMNIFGGSVTKGVDKIDDDTRGGLMAYGILFEKVNVPDPNKKYRSIDDK